jgi:hypothetical protein
VPVLRVLNPGRRPIRCGQACLDCPQWTPDGPYHCWPMARGHTRGRRIKPRNLPAAILHRQLPPHLRFPSRHFLLLPPPRYVRGPLNLPSRSGCLARDIPGTHLSESPALFFRRRAYHLSDRPFRFSSHPLPLRRISSCPTSFLLSLLASDKSRSAIDSKPPGATPRNTLPTVSSSHHRPSLFVFLPTTTTTPAFSCPRPNNDPDSGAQRGTIRPVSS